MGRVMRKHVFKVSDTNRAIQPQKMARGLKFWIKKVEGLYYVAKTSSPKGNDRSPENKQVFPNSSQVS